MGNTPSRHESSNNGSNPEGPPDTPTDSACTSMAYDPWAGKLRYTPPPSELHLYLDRDVDPPEEFARKTTPRALLSASTPDVEMSDAPTESKQHDTPATTASPYEGTNINEPEEIAKEGKIMLKIPSFSGRKGPPGTGDVKSPKHEDKDEPPVSATLRTSHYYPGRNAEESEQRFQRILQRISDDPLVTHPLDSALESVMKEPPGKSKVVKEDVALSRLHRIYDDFEGLDLEIRLLNAGLIIGTSNHFGKEFEKALAEDPVTLEKVLRLDAVLHRIRGMGGIYRSIFTDWVESLISTILNLKLSEMWNNHTTRDRRRFTETAFQEARKLEENNELDSDEIAQEFKTWSKHQERMTVVRNQTWKLYKLFGATVLLEVNTFRPVFDGQPLTKSVPFAPVIRHISTRLKEAIKEGDQLLLFQAKFWEDDLEDAEDLGGEELWSEWITRSHTSASRVIIPIVKATAGEKVADWVSRFLLDLPPDGFICHSDSDSDSDSNDT